MTKCSVWLKDYLAQGWKLCDDVKEAALAAGFSKRDLQIARAELRVVPGSVTVWKLPEDEA